MICICRVILFLAVFASLLCSPVAHAQAQRSWRTIAQGLELAEIPADTAGHSASSITALKISPKHYEFVLLMSSKEGEALTPEEWTNKYNLTALINASMYLPDNSKSTGYMRDKTHINNGFIHNSFGSFFVANPLRKNLPPVNIIDRHQQQHQQLLPYYSTVVQNYRLFSSSRKPLWPNKAKETSIAAVAKDASGNIVFIHSRTPMTVRNFTKVLLESRLHLETAM